MNRSKSKSSRKVRSRRVIPKLKKGGLTRYGYSVRKSQKARRRSLKKALNEYGYSSLIKKLNAVKVLSRNTSPSNSKIYGKDIKYLQSMKRNDGVGSEYKFYICKRRGEGRSDTCIVYSKLNKEEVLNWLEEKYPEDDFIGLGTWTIISELEDMKKDKDIQELTYIVCE